jgi:hypothetical protein
VDSYQTRYIAVARLLWDASNGIPGDIPQDYCEHLDHEYEDGDISLVSLISKFESYSELDDFEIEEAIELLGKVSPGDWPYIGDIESVSVEELLRIYDKDAAPDFDFVEDNLSTADRVEKSLIEVISSVFGDKVSTIRSEKGYYANPKNNFLQDEDGTFAGTFMYDDHKFIFEVFPEENGWVTTYRLHWDALEKIPNIPDADNPKKTDYTRQIRNRGWR